MLRRYSVPTTIQAAMIIASMFESHMIGFASTGTGKTVSYLLSTLSGIIRKGVPFLEDFGGIVTIVLPTRELVVQVSEDSSVMGRMINLRYAVLLDNYCLGQQTSDFLLCRDLVVCTAGRLADVLQERICFGARLSYLVLDEADRLTNSCDGMRLLDALKGDVRNLFFNFARVRTRRRYTSFKRSGRALYLMSATSLSDVLRYFKASGCSFMTLGVSGRDSGSGLVQHRLRVVRQHEKYSVLVEELNKIRFCKVLVFVNSCNTADLLCKRLLTDGWHVLGVTGEMSLKRRLSAIRSFRDGKCFILVATDIIGRGIDIPGIKCILNFDVPGSVDIYTHRVGRTGRAGDRGFALSLLTLQDRGFVALLKEHFFEFSQVMSSEILNTFDLYDH